MGSVYKAEQEVYDLMKVQVANHHPDLALYVDEIAIVFQEKASKVGDKVILGKPSKANALFGVLGDVDFKFVLTLAADEWLNLTRRQQGILLDSLLCACRAEEDDKGNVKCRIARPDVSYFYDELDRYGDWYPRPPEDGPESPLERIFGKKFAKSITSEDAADDDQGDDQGDE
jgi:hypothetical protein